MEAAEMMRWGGGTFAGAFRMTVVVKRRWK